MDVITNAAQQTPGQWAVRWHGVVCVLLLLASVPVVHLVWYVGLGHDEPLLRTRSQVPAPVATAKTVTDGTWMLAKEKELRELSPTVWWLRAQWNELRYRAGVPESSQVHFGSDEWFFLQQTVTPDEAAFVRNAPLRRHFFAEVRDLVHRAGAQLFVVLIPNKVRVYADRAFADGVLPGPVAGNYATVLGELRAEGIDTVDLAAAMAAARAEQPAFDLYFRRDTHWRPAGAMVGGRTVAAAIEQRFGALLSPRGDMEVGGNLSVPALGDLVASQAFASVELPRADSGYRTTAMSLLTDHFSEVRDYYTLKQRTAGGVVTMGGDDPAAEVLLLGTSFAKENGLQALALFLGRPVRMIASLGAAGMQPLRDAKAELEAGTKAKVVVWEIVERGLFEPDWNPPHW